MSKLFSADRAGFYGQNNFQVCTFLCGCVVLVLLVFSCVRNNSEPSDVAEFPVYQTWHSLREQEYGKPIPSPTEEIPPTKFFPWAGTASHHLLAHEYIDAWFSRLADMRKVQCFYILSPAHYGVEVETYSLTCGSWETGFGAVQSDKEKVNRLAQRLNVSLDPWAFRVEHGVSTLMPYIKKYFPKSKVVAVAYDGDISVNIPISSRLADALENAFDKKGKRKNFLLISTDFSHRGNIKETAETDYNSRRYLNNPADISWYMVGCDNRPGIYILDKLGKKNLESFILYHTNSWEISTQWEHDITSYFFVYFADKVSVVY
jgi:AmmeMemoRadiSam system protein B